MNPQYMQQPPQQYNPPPSGGYGGYGAPPPTHQMQQPQQQFRGPPQNGPAPPSQSFPGSMSPGQGPRIMGPPPGGQIGLPPSSQHSAPPTPSMVPPSTTSQVQSQMAGMNINGQRMQPPLPSSFPSGPTKPQGPPSSFPPAVNGTSPPDVIASPQFPPQPHPPGQQYNARPPPPTSQAQYMNGAPQATGPGRGQMPPMPGKPGQYNSGPGFPPQPNSGPGFPPQPNSGPNLPPQPNSGSGFPPQPNSGSGFPPQPNSGSGFPPQPSIGQGFPPQPNSGQGFPPQPVSGQGFPPQPNSGQGFPPQPNSVQGFPPQPPSGYPPLPQQGFPPQQTSQPPGMYPSGGQYPPQPGQYPSQQGQYPQQQARRLDPDQMPSPMQVVLDDQRTKGGLFLTNQRGQVPPLVTTNFLVQDQGNASPRYLRSTMYSVPISHDMMKQAAVPFGLVISPMAVPMDEEHPPPIVDMGEIGPIRCIRCKAYMSPFMQFIDGGRRFQCLFCKATTEVPDVYFQHLDHTGLRVDRYERPELVLGAYELVATKEYCRNDLLPKPPAYIFMIDVSYNNMKSGMVHVLCANMKEILKLLPKEEGENKTKMRVGFVTYNSTVHFYNVKSCLAQPQMLVVGDVNEMFMPLLDGFLVDPEESASVIDSLMEQIPEMFGDTRETETILYPVIQAGMEALKASECVGKLLVFHTSLPIAEAPGKLQNRDDRKLLGTEKEKSILNPQSNVYNNLAQDCVAVGCSVDLFVLNNSYIDLATIGQVCRLTGGEIFKYTYFQANIDGERLIEDVKHDVSRQTVFDAVMRVRTSTGVRATDFFGHFFISNARDMELASIDCDKGLAVEINHDDKLTEEEGVFVQVALLHTSCGGQRRIRILNLSLKSCSQMADLYRTCELDTIVNFFSKQALFRLKDHPPKEVKDNLVNRCAMMLACYRKNCASPSSAGQLILPECMKLLPLYVSCMLKSDALSGGSDMTVDDRTFVMEAVNIMDIPSSVVYFYPRLIPVHDIDPTSNDIPQPVRCSVEKMKDDGAYLLENGIHMFLWLGSNISSEWVQTVFEVNNVAQIDTDKTRLPDLDNPLSQRLRDLISVVRFQRHRFMRLTLVRQRDKMEMLLKHFLVEDRGVDGSSSYVDFLCHMHKEIRNILNILS